MRRIVVAGLAGLFALAAGWSALARPATVSAAGCTWAGAWDTRISGDRQRMFLNGPEDLLAGTYAGDRRIFNTRVAADSLTGNWQSTKDAGRFVFTLAPDCFSFTGTWGFGEATAGVGTWTGTRISVAGEPEPPPTVEEVATGLKVPWSLAFAPDSRLFMTQQPCRVDVLLPVAGGFDPTPRHLLTLADCVDVGDGLRGLALAPDFAASHNMYVVYTYRKQDGALATRVSRLTERDGGLHDERVVLQDIPGGEFHTAGRVEFGPDGKLYLATGDALDTTLPQNPTSLGGKILRFNPDGSVPTDNPYPGSYVYSMGHRNPQGLAWHPSTHQLFIVDHGPSPTIAGEPGTCCHDEINIVGPATNYGWPVHAGRAGDPRYTDPVLESGTSTWAPASALFYTGARFPGWNGALLFGGLISQQIGLMHWKAGQEQHAEARLLPILPGAFGRIRALAQGPDEYLYFVTSNTDGRSGAVARPGDDRLLRVIALPGAVDRYEQVRAIYLELLAREPDGAGAHFWVNTPLTISAIRAQFAATPDAQRVAAVRALYQELLLRDPIGGDNAGLRSWVDGPLPLPDVRAAIAGSPEGARVLAIRALYAELLGRPDDAAGIRFWYATPLSIDEIRQELLRSDEYRQKHPAAGE